MPLSPKYKITVKRKSQFMDGNVPMDILINGFLAHQLKNGETKTINLYITDDNEPVELSAHLMMNKTPPVILMPAEIKDHVFLIRNVVSNVVFFIGLALAILSTILVFSTNNLMYMILVAPPAAFHLYYKLIRKDRYLSIRKLKKD